MAGIENDQPRPTPLCRGEGCFKKDWCLRWDPDARGDDAFDDAPIDKFSGECEFFVDAESANADS